MVALGLRNKDVISQYVNLLSKLQIVESSYSETINFSVIPRVFNWVQLNLDSP
jgi:hypothetical protein